VGRIHREGSIEESDGRADAASVEVPTGGAGGRGDPGSGTPDSMVR